MSVLCNTYGMILIIGDLIKLAWGVEDKIIVRPPLVEGPVFFFGIPFDSYFIFVILVVFMVAIFGFAGLSLDVGNTLLQRKKIHEGTDAAAIAAVRDWADGQSSSAVIALGESFCSA